MAHQALFKDSLKSKTGTVATAEALSGKVVGIYFSAHWCPPCRGFTPVLAQWYNDNKDKNIEIVFVSSDQGQEAFDGYYADMPWLALPYADREQKGVLAAKYGVSGIPCLVLIDEQGELITKDGRSKITGSPNDFPWK